MGNPCAAALTRRLAEHGGWMGRTALTAGLRWGDGVLDDELADLVVAGTVMFNARGREYRLGGTLWARRAMRDLVRRGARRAAVMGQSTDRQHAHVGMAQRVDSADGTEQLVMAELQTDYGDIDAMVRLAGCVASWTTQ